MTTPLDSATAISSKRRKFRQSESVYDRFGPFFFAHAQNRHYLCFQSEICYHCHSQRHRFPIKGRNFCDLTTFRIILAIGLFCWACAETAISEVASTILTATLDSAIRISFKGRKFRQSESVSGCFGPFFLAHEQNRHYLCFRSEVCYHQRSQRHRFSINGWKLLRFDNVSDNFSHILTAHAQKQLLLSFGLQL